MGATAWNASQPKINPAERMLFKALEYAYQEERSTLRLKLRGVSRRGTPALAPTGCCHLAAALRRIAEGDGLAQKTTGLGSQ